MMKQNERVNKKYKKAKNKYLKLKKSSKENNYCGTFALGTL
jgi:hypothetical protein